MESTDCLPPHPTGRADFPHPAVPDSFARGVRKELHDVTSQHHQTEVLAVCVKGPPGWWPVPSLAPLLGLLAQPVSQTSKVRGQAGPVVRHRWLRSLSPLSRGGMTGIQAAHSSSYTDANPAGPLRSTGVTPLPRYYGPRRPPAGAGHAVMLSRLPFGPERFDRPELTAEGLTAEGATKITTMHPQIAQMTQITEEGAEG